MGSQEFLNICKAKVSEYYNQKKDKTDASPTANTGIESTGIAAMALMAGM